MFITGWSKPPRHFWRRTASRAAARLRPTSCRRTPFQDAAGGREAHPQGDSTGKLGRCLKLSSVEGSPVVFFWREFERFFPRSAAGSADKKSEVSCLSHQEFMESAPVTAPLDQIPAKFAHYLTSVDKKRQDAISVLILAWTEPSLPWKDMEELCWM